MSRLHVIGLDGSTRDDSTTLRILAAALEGARKAGATTEVIRLRDAVRAPFHGTHDPAALAAKGAWDAMPSAIKALVPTAVRRLSTDQLMPDDVRAIVRAMEAAQGVVVATPVWWSTPSDSVKTLLNYLTLCDYRGYSLRGKAAACMAVCEEDGAQHANMLVLNALTHMGMATAPFGSFFYHRKMAGRSEEDWQETDQALVGANVARLARLLTGAVARPDWDWSEPP